MVKIEDYIQKFHAEDPSLTREDMTKKLQSVDDPYRPGKQCWSNNTIKHRVKAFYRSKEKKIEFAEGARIEGRAITRHPDIFEPRGEPLRKTENATSKGASESNKASSDFQKEVSTFEREIVSIVSSLKDDADRTNESLVKSLSGLRSDVLSLQDAVSRITQGLKAVEPEVEYDDIELKKSTVEAIKRTCEERKIDDESDYVDMLMSLEKKYDLTDRDWEANKHKLVRFDNLVSAVKEAGGRAVFRMDYDSDKDELSIVPRHGFGVGIRGFAIGVGVGVLVGVSVVLSYLHFTGFI